MHVWNVLHVSRLKYNTQKLNKKSPSANHRTNLSNYIFANKACIDNRKTLVKQQYLLQMYPQYDELLSTNGWGRLASLGHPQQISTGFASSLRYCSDVAQRKLTKPCTMCGRLLDGIGLLEYIFECSCPLTLFCQVQNNHFDFASKSCTVRHSSSGHQPKLAAWYKEWNYGTLAEGATCIRQAAITLDIGPHYSC